MLRTRLFKLFALLILLFAVLSGLYSVNVIRDRVVHEAQNRVRTDLNSAWYVYAAKLGELRTVVHLASAKKQVVETCRDGRWDDEETAVRLDYIRRTFGLDFLTLVDGGGVVRLRASAPGSLGDSRLNFAPVARALRGDGVEGAVLLSAEELGREDPALAERALLTLEATPKARPTTRDVESRGMALVSSVPVFDGPRVAGVLYGGVLLNRNHGFVDDLLAVIYPDDVDTETPLGTATLFLQDSRISTTVRSAGGNRALGTRASKEVADRVLDNGAPWIGRAFVVRDYYLTAYDPIRDLDGEIIGMLYVGVLEKPFRQIGHDIIRRYVYLTAGVLILSLVLAFVFAGKLARPIHQLALAARQLERGSYPPPVPAGDANSETSRLVEGFNAMTASLRDREARLSEANEQLHAVNRNYMEILGFVTHQFNTPIGSIMNYAYLLKQEKTGPLDERQRKAVRVIGDNARRLAEMVRHYLKLSRIERGELNPHPSRIAVQTEILAPLLESLEPEMVERGMRVDNRIPEQVAVWADPAFTREVFENLIGNAIKYGREEALIALSAQEEGEWVRFVVRNEGPGIEPALMDRLFERFSRGDPAHARAKGTGLGLFISRRIVEAHGGTIEADSELGEWAEFRFTLPRQAPGNAVGGEGGVRG